jgi:hypothetical protein
MAKQLSYINENNKIIFKMFWEGAGKVLDLWNRPS